VSDVRPDARARLGIWFVQEGHRVFRRLTVEQNLKVMLHGAGYRGSELRQRVRNVYNSIRLLGDRRHLIAGALSGGQQQLLALSAALAIEPKLLLLDEPSAGLAPQVVKECLELIRIAKRAGAAVIIVEQRPDLVVGLCENVLTMENGMVVST
jgi:branched-chain amino acid transport system ATP-binding protein